MRYYVSSFSKKFWPYPTMEPPGNKLFCMGNISKQAIYYVKHQNLKAVRQATIKPSLYADVERKSCLEKVTRPRMGSRRGWWGQAGSPVNGASLCEDLGAVTAFLDAHSLSPLNSGLLAFCTGARTLFIKWRRLSESCFSYSQRRPGLGLESALLPASSSFFFLSLASHCQKSIYFLRFAFKTTSRESQSYRDPSDRLIKLHANLRPTF